MLSLAKWTVVPVLMCWKIIDVSFSAIVQECLPSPLTHFSRSHFSRTTIFHFSKTLTLIFCSVPSCTIPLSAHHFDGDGAAAPVSSCASDGSYPDNISAALSPSTLQVKPGMPSVSFSLGCSDSAGNEAVGLGRSNFFDRKLMILLSGLRESCIAAARIRRAPSKFSCLLRSLTNSSYIWIASWGIRRDFGLYQKIERME